MTGIDELNVTCVEEMKGTKYVYMSNMSPLSLIYYNLSIICLDFVFIIFLNLHN